MMTITPAEQPTSTADAALLYERDGFVVAAPVIPVELLQRANHAMDEIIAGRYETGIPPHMVHFKPGDEHSGKLLKIDQPHLSNSAIRELITHPTFGKWIGHILGAHFVQVWAVQLLHKPAGGDVLGSVGWHQDYQYWQHWWTPESELFTAWLAISDVELERGPVCFVRGSHRWGFLNAGDFFSTEQDAVRQQIKPPPGEAWEEVAAVMPAGAFSLHHRHTYHGSHSNRSTQPRRSFAIHLRTNRSTPIPMHQRPENRRSNYDYTAYLDDLHLNPVIWRD